MKAGKCIVVGAGIGGLATGIALKKIGMQVEIYEKAAELKEVGAGILLYPNALTALQKLGVFEEIALRGSTLRHGSYMLSDRPLFEINAANSGLESSGIAIHRADLQRVLADAFGRQQIFTDCQCKDVYSDKDSATIILADGRTISGDCVIGADGLHSVVRAKVLNDGPPNYVGCFAWRGVCSTVPASVGKERAFVMFGRGLQFGGAHIGGEKVYWFGAVADPDGKKGQHSQSDLLSTFLSWTEPVPILLRQTDEEDILCHDLYDRPPATKWSSGRITLLGDAAHPMTPFMGQGGCQALEDSIALAAALKHHDSFDAAFRYYEQSRIPRTTSFVEQSRKSQSMSLLKNPFACGLRDFMLQAVPKSFIVKHLHTLSDYELPDI